ncbi:uncharacterized protein LOC110432212 [Sorghum bicolor]|uniref:uncharacterized protein LOC110432212 n=1 Tax=Sorghum bicolor TaxID=4558 RepID=UPI000B4260FB|nr:uncharacterized protein LOC110432212 [Sorghum bicolor]|eukprot:XP_021307871.1 uncharacterized protein LOC110432212 [Sorghum bicolor]
MHLARAYERRNAPAPLALPAPQRRRSTGVPATFPASASSSSPTPAAAAAVQRPFKRLSPEEMADRRKQGLCYNCDEPYIRGHKCARLFFLEAADYIVEEPDDSDEDGPAASGTSLPPFDPDAPMISLSAITGIRAPSTMQLQVRIGAHHLTALLDSGSTHNFISTEAAGRVGVPLQDSRGAHVVVANSDRVECRGLARGVPLQIGAESFRVDMYSIPVHGCDIVLGIAWLRTLGPILCDFEQRRMAFHLKGRRVVWAGVAASGTSPRPSSDPLLANNLFTDLGSEQDLLERFLATYDDVFAAPTGLPPARACDHRIHLKTATELVAVRPYRYPQLQKDELETQCDAMLQQGIIRPSTSPFSAPVLLVKKQDSSWRFCVDYRALNAATVKDKFPIPVVEELLDELNGARFFSKLDLRSGYHQVRVHPDDVAKTAFRTHHGPEFLVMPFGLSNAPSTFQALMNLVLKPFLRRWVLVFFDDILIYSKSWTEHLHHLRAVLNVLRAHQLHLKRSKCSFATSSVQYLGHVISASGVAMDASKVEAVKSWPQPRSARGLRGVPGLGRILSTIHSRFWYNCSPSHPASP